MSQKTSVLVAILNNVPDFYRARDEGWYRLPVKSAPRLTHPDILAFYQTKIFDVDRWSISWYAEVQGVDQLTRQELLPDQPDHVRAHDQYYCLRLGPLQRKENSIPSRVFRRMTFIPTTWKKFQEAEEINDLWDESPLEDELWYAFKHDGIMAERQFEIHEAKTGYILDFAIACDRGHLDVECDGDTYHLSPEAVRYDKRRNNWLSSRGWNVLRFDSKEINTEMPKCLVQVKLTINKLGGMKRPDTISRLFHAETTDYPEQLELW
jgi:very-short-patch-repair endonuclease